MVFEKRVEERGCVYSVFRVKKTRIYVYVQMQRNSSSTSSEHQTVDPRLSNKCMTKDFLMVSQYMGDKRTEPLTYIWKWIREGADLG